MIYQSFISKKEMILIGMVLLLAGGLMVWMIFRYQIGIMGVIVEDYGSIDNRPVVGVVLKANDSEHWRLVKKGAEDAGEALNSRVMVMSPDKESNAAMQFQIIRDLATMGIDALCVAPNDSGEILPVLEEVADDGILIITMDTNADEMENVLSYVGTDNYSAGFIAGERMVKRLDGCGEVLIIAGVLNQLTHGERVRGFSDAIINSDISIVDILEADSDYDMAYVKVESYLTEYPMLEGLFVTSDLMTMGAVKAIEDNKSNRTFTIIGFDVQKESLVLISENLVDSIVSQSPYDIGYKAVTLAVKSIYGEKIPNYIETNAVLITKEDVSSYKFLFE